jgi:hypothetical protein
VLAADAFRRHGWAVRAPNVLQTAAAPNDYYGALFIDAAQIGGDTRDGQPKDHNGGCRPLRGASDLIADSGRVASQLIHWLPALRA